MTADRFERDSALSEESMPAATARGYGSVPFLTQPRAHSALRTQLTAIETALASEMENRRAHDAAAMFEMHVVPHRVIARLGDTGLSFSWVVAVGGKSSTVAEGSLLVIEWTGIATDARGIAALRSAQPGRECSYRPDAADGDHWRWRVDDVDAAGTAMYTTAALVAEWLSGSPAPRAD
jgi:hypothetical protein